MIDLSQVKSFTTDLHRAPSQVLRLVDVTARRIADGTASVIAAEAPVHTGILRGSIRGETSQSVLIGSRAESQVISDCGYALIQDQGRRPGKMPPETPIRRWVELKLGIRGREARSVTYLIRRKIGRHGTVGHRYIDRAMRTAEPRIDAEIANLETAIARVLEGGR